MRWSALSVLGEMGVEEGIPCSLCGRKITDIAFFPDCRDEALWAWVNQMYGDTVVACEDCVAKLSRAFRRWFSRYE